MATSKEFLTYFLEQLKDIQDISVKPMMGEYLLYYRGKLVGDICDNCVFIKPINVALEMMPDSELKPPYNGAKNMLVMDSFEDVQFVRCLFERMYPELPVPKIRKRK